MSKKFQVHPKHGDPSSSAACERVKGKWKHEFLAFAMGFLLMTPSLPLVLNPNAETPPVLNPQWMYSINRAGGYSNNLVGEAILVKGSTVLAATSKGESGQYGWTIYALDSRTGRYLWAKDLVTCTFLAATDRYVLVYAFDPSLELSSRLGLHCWNITDGSHVWTSLLVVNLAIGACMSSDEGIIYLLGVSSNKGDLIAVRIEDGFVLWRKQLDEHSQLSYPSKPIYFEGKVFFFQNNRKKLSAVDALTGNILWSVQIPPYGGITDPERDIDTGSATLPPLLARMQKLLIYRTLKTIWCRDTASGELSSSFNLLPEETKASGDDRVEKVGMAFYGGSLVLRSGPFWYVLNLPYLSLLMNITYEQVSHVGYHLYPYASYNDDLIGSGFCGPPYCPTAGETYCGYFYEGVVTWVANPPASYITAAAAVAQEGVLYICYSTGDVLVAAYNYGQVPETRELSVEIVYSPMIVEVGETDRIMIRVTWAGQGIPHTFIRIFSSNNGFAQPMGQTDDGGVYVTDFIPTIPGIYEVRIEATKEGFLAGNRTLIIMVTEKALRVTVSASPDSIYRSSVFDSHIYLGNSTIVVTVYYSRFIHSSGATYEVREPISDATVVMFCADGWLDSNLGSTDSSGRFQTRWHPPRCAPFNTFPPLYFCEEDWFTITARASKDGYAPGNGSTSVHIKKAFSIQARAEDESIKEDTEIAKYHTKIIVSVNNLWGSPISGAEVKGLYKVGDETIYIGGQGTELRTNSSGIAVFTWPPPDTPHHNPGLYEINVTAFVSDDVPIECTSATVQVVSSDDWDSDGIPNIVDPFPLVRILLTKSSKDPCLTYYAILKLFKNQTDNSYYDILIEMKPNQDWILVEGKYGRPILITLNASKWSANIPIILDYGPLTGNSTISFVDVLSRNQSTFTLPLPKNYKVYATDFKWARNGYSFPNPMEAGGYCYGMSETAILFFDGTLTTASGAQIIAYEKTWDEMQGLVKFHQYRQLIRWGEGFWLAQYFPDLVDKRANFDALYNYIKLDEPAIALMPDDKHAVVVTKIVKASSSDTYYIFVYNPNDPYPSGILAWYLKFDGANFYKSDGCRTNVVFASARVYAISYSLCYIYFKCLGDLTITDSQGRRIGYVSGTFVREIPNAAGVEFEGLEMYTLPRNATYTISVKGMAAGNYSLQIVLDEGDVINVVMLNSTISTLTSDTIRIFANNSMFLINPNEDKAYTLQLEHLATNASGTFDLSEVQAKKDITHFISIPEWKKLGTPQATIVLAVDDDKDGKPDRQFTLLSGISSEDINNLLYPKNPWLQSIIIVVAVALLLVLGSAYFIRRKLKHSSSILLPPPPPPPPPQST